MEGAPTAEPPAETALPYMLAGIGEKTVWKLVEGGFESIEAVAAATVVRLSELPGIGEKTAEKILAAARAEHGTGEPPAADAQEPS